MLKPRNFSPDAAELSHFFMMFDIHKYLLVSEQFKDAWEARGLTGAAFKYVTEMPDSLFPSAGLLTPGSRKVV